MTTSADKARSELEKRMIDFNGKNKARAHFTHSAILILSVFLSAFRAVHAENKEWGKIGLKTVSITTDGTECPIKLNDPYGGRLTKNGYVVEVTPPPTLKPLNIRLELECRDASDIDSMRFNVFRFDAKTLSWKKDVSHLESIDKNNVEPYIKLFTISSINSHAIGATETLPPGGDMGYPVSFYFCLRHPPRMLCGSSSDAGGVKNLNSTHYLYNKIPEILKIIGSIEFIN
jgi:hypothetical protein